MRGYVPELKEAIQAINEEDPLQGSAKEAELKKLQQELTYIKGAQPDPQRTDIDDDID